MIKTAQLPLVVLTTALTLVGVGVGWSGWGAFNPPAAGLNEFRPSITWLPSGRRVDVFVNGETDGHIYQMTWTAGTSWSGWTDLG